MDQIICDGGLDLVRARPATEPGRLQECLNYEVGWVRGYSRIDGFERFDGSVSPSSTTGWVLEVDDAYITGSFLPPEQLTWSDGNTVGDAGTLVLTESITPGQTKMFIVFRTGRVRPTYNSIILGSESGAALELAPEAVISLTTFPDYYSDQEEYQEALDDHATILRAEVNPVPGTGTIVGLHYHEDSLYAIRDVLQVTLTSGSTALQAGMYVYNAAGQVGQVVSVNDGNVLSISAVDDEGFSVEATDTLSIALSIRFEDGSGAFDKYDNVIFSTGWTGEVAHMSLRDGSFDSASGLGEAVFMNRTAGSDPTSGSCTNQSQTGTLQMERSLYGHSANAVTVESVSTQAAEASMWKSTDEGWVPAPVGGVIQFENAETEILDSDYVLDSKSKFCTSETDATGGLTSWKWADNNNIRASDGAVASVSFTNPYGYQVGSVALATRGFYFGLLDDDVITGFEVKFLGVEFDVASSNHFDVWANDGGTPRKFSTDDFAAVDGIKVEIAGADNTNWSAVTGTNPSPATVNEYGFGFNFELRLDDGEATDFELDSMEVKVYYKTPVGTYLYLYNGSSDVGFIKRSNLPVLTIGDWDDATAGAAGGSGYLRITDWTPYTIAAGLEIWTGPGGTGARIGITTTTGSLVPTLPGSLLLDENRSRYEMISYNFYASEDRNAIYGVNGAGPAFSYDGSVLEFIYTGLDLDKEKPRHVAPHLFSLALGYLWGEVYTSEPGEPTSYDGTAFAATYGFGDKITGLMPAAGDALAVFTESTTNVLTGSAADENNPSQQRVINHKIGAIEYSVQSIGNRPIFASFRGVETLETMDEFSDFFTAPMTYDVSPWLLERLQSAAGLEATDKSVVNSVVVRNKNQYRLFFADGYLATLTLVGQEREPQNTIQRYNFNSDENDYARCYATASGVTSDGRDRAFFSVEAQPYSPDQPSGSDPTIIDYVYELDRGRSFDGGTIHAQFSITHNFGVDAEGQPAPHATARYNVFHVHGKAHAYAGLRISRSANYEYLDDPELNYELVTMGALDHPPEDTLNPKYAKGRHGARGFALTFHVDHESSVEFPHIIQMITMLDDTANKVNR